jgi:hypothetical protein
MAYSSTIRFNVVLLMLLAADTATAAVDELSAARTAMAQRVMAIQDISITASRLDRQEPIPDEILQEMQDIARKEGGGVFVPPRLLAYDESLAYLDGSLRYERSLTASTLAKARAERWPLDAQLIVTGTRERSEELVRKIGDDRVVGLIDNRIDLPSDVTLDVAMGLRLYNDPDWLNAGSFDAMVLKSTTATSSTVTLVTANGLLHEWVLDRANGYVPVQYCVFSKDRELEHVDYTNFKHIGDILVPFQYTRKLLSYDENGVQGTRDTATVTISTFQIRDPKNISGRFVMTWPVGSSILDHRTNLRLMVRSRPRVLTDADIVDVLRRKNLNGSQQQNQLQRELDGLSPQPQSAPTSQP